MSRATEPDPDAAAFFASRCTPEYEAKVAAARDRERARAAELAAIHAPKKLVAQGVPLVLAQTVGDHRQLFATECLRYVNRPDRRAVTVLSGVTGCGKSMAGAALIARIGVGWFVSAAELAALDRKRVGDRSVFERALAAQCLVVDDVGTETITDDWLASLDLLIDKRVGFRRATVITTNLRATVTADEERAGKRGFQRAYGPRVWSRLLGLGRGVYLESSDPDYRALRRSQEAG